jgi:hypothetical protein
VAYIVGQLKKEANALSINHKEFLSYNSRMVSGSLDFIAKLVYAVGAGDGKPNGSAVAPEFHSRWCERRRGRTERNDEHLLTRCREQCALEYPRDGSPLCLRVRIIVCVSIGKILEPRLELIVPE